MTTWESTDNVEVMDNITITSDAAYERVTSDEHFEEEKNWGYLQQNTSWLVQEIPNIAFIDIADTMLESKKTLYNRENWILRVWEKGRSIEVQPQDTVSLIMNADYDITQTWKHLIEFDDKISTLNFTVCEPQSSWNVYHAKILQTWYYTISYWWEVKTNSATSLNISVAKWYVGADVIVMDRYKDTQLPEILSWWKSMPNVYLEKWDVVDMYILCDSAVTIYKTTYLNIQFQQYSWYSNI